MKIINNLFVAISILSLSSCQSAGNKESTTDTLSSEESSSLSNSESINESEQSISSVENTVSSSSSENLSEKEYYEYTSIEITKAMGLGFNLGNSFESAINGFPDDAYANSIVEELGFENRELFCEVRNNEDKLRGKTTQKTIDAIYEKGFRSIRIPVSWSNHMDSNGLINEAWLNRIKEVVDYVMNYEDMFVIINLMEQTSVIDTYSLENAKYNFTFNLVTSVWTQVAKCFKDYDARLIFENLNEPLHNEKKWTMDPLLMPALYKECNENLLKYNQAFVDCVRNENSFNNKNRFLLCGTYGNIAYYAYDQKVSNVSKWSLPIDNSVDKLICNFHYYSPYDFCYGKVDSFSTTSDQSSNNGLAKGFKLLNENFVQKGYGVVLTEWGTVFKPNQLREAARANYAYYFANQATKNDIAIMVWDNNNRSTSWGTEYFGFLNRHYASGLYDNMSNLSGVKYNNEKLWFSEDIISKMFEGYLGA